MTVRNAVLVTGAAGHVGAEVVARLVKRGHDVIALVHDRSEILANNGRGADPAQMLRCEVRSPDLGIDPVHLTELARRVGLVVHCAAVTDFGLPARRYTELNVNGTANALELARRFDAGFVHVSTAYVCGEMDGTFGEDQLDVAQNFGNDYESSKFRAEQLVRAAALRWTIVRPGIVSGEYRTGYSRVYKHIYHVVKLTAEGKMRTLPGSYAATLALSPIGHVADTVAAAVERFDENVGCTFHAVGANTISLRSMSDVLAEYPSLRMADLVPPSTFSPEDLDDIERAYFNKLGRFYTTYLKRHQHFDSTNTRTRLGVTPPTIGAGYLRRILDSCLQTGYLGRPEPSVAEVLAEFQLQRSGR